MACRCRPAGIGPKRSCAATMRQLLTRISASANVDTHRTCAGYCNRVRRLREWFLTYGQDQVRLLVVAAAARPRRQRPLSLAPEFTVHLAVAARVSRGRRASGGTASCRRWHPRSPVPRCLPGPATSPARDPEQLLHAVWGLGRRPARTTVIGRLDETPDDAERADTQNRPIWLQTRPQPTQLLGAPSRRSVAPDAASSCVR